jgi:hypothetical protein
MSAGVAVIRYLLANNAPVLAVVPATRIISGELPINTVMPAIGIEHVDSVPINDIRINETPKVWITRVSVRAYRKDEPDDRGYPGLKTLLDLVRTACASQRATINSVNVHYIAPDIEGPDMPLPDVGIFTRTQDFLVRWST